MKMTSAWCRSARCRKSAMIALLASNQLWIARSSSTFPPHFLTKADVPSPPSEYMLGVFGGFDPLIEVERDRPLGNVEDEVAVGTQVAFPPGIGLLEKIVDQLLKSHP